MARTQPITATGKMGTISAQTSPREFVGMALSHDCHALFNQFRLTSEDYDASVVDSPGLNAILVVHVTFHKSSICLTILSLGLCKGYNPWYYLCPTPPPSFAWCTSWFNQRFNHGSWSPHCSKCPGPFKLTRTTIEYSHVFLNVSIHHYTSTRRTL